MKKHSLYIFALILSFCATNHQITYTTVKENPQKRTNYEAVISMTDQIGDLFQKNTPSGGMFKKFLDVFENEAKKDGLKTTSDSENNFLEYKYIFTDINGPEDESRTLFGVLGFIIYKREVHYVAISGENYCDDLLGYPKNKTERIERAQKLLTIESMLKNLQIQNEVFCK